MANLEQLKKALIQADTAGDTKAAELFAQDIKKLQTTQPIVDPRTIPERYEDLPPKQEPTIGEKVVGAGEAALATGTAMTTGAVGHIVGAIKGIAKSIKDGTYGSMEGAREMEKLAQEYAGELTYEPRTKTGKEYTQDVAETVAPLEALTPMTAEIGAMGRNIPQNIPRRRPKPKVEKVEEGLDLEGIAVMSVDAAQGNKKAKANLAREVKANPEAIDAADRLGIELPADVLGDNTLIKQTVGLVRSQVGEESAKFADMIDNAVTKSDEALSTLEQSDLATMSGKIMDNFNKSLSDLNNQAAKIYGEVTNKIEKNSEVTVNNSKEAVLKYLDDLGIVPDEKGKADLRGLTKEERDLYRLVTSPKVTFGALERERRGIGEALGKMPTGKYANSDKSLLKKLYGSLKKDQLDNVETILGKDARDQLHLADRTFQKKIALEERAADVFGKEGDKSIASLLRRSMLQGSKGDITALNKVFKNVPQELQKEAIGSALADIATSKQGRFNFNDYVKLYQGLRKNAPIYNKIIKTLGEDKHKLLQDLYVTSKRLQDAKNKIISTGKANQAILNKIQEEALLQRVIRFTVEKGVKTATFGGLQPSLDMLFKAPKDKIKAISDLFVSQEFKNLAVDAIDKTPGMSKVKAFTNSKAFKKWNKTIGNTIKEPETWILESFTLNKEQNNENNK